MNIKKNIPLTPSRLMPGDKVGIAAPASPFDRKKLYQGIAVLESMGFRIAIPDDLFSRKGYLAGQDTCRADQVNRLFADREVKAIVCARGGFGSLRILSFLDYGSIRKHPKIFIGFSDISAILMALYLKCGLITFHGPTVTNLKDATQETKEAMLSAFSSDRKLEIKLKKGVAVKPGVASGPVLGGNLTTLSHLVGTPFEPSFTGRILLLEDLGEAPYRIDRMLTHMKLAGCFNGLAGIVLGSFKDSGTLDEIYRIMEDLFKETTIPILAGFDIGHGKDNITIPLGLEATLDAGSHRLTFDKPTTRV
jgi:muramoyltetrapeptide carboxypeptidase